MLTLIRELFPFLKEALFEGQPFRVWMKTNWLTFVWLVSMLALTLSIVYLVETIHKMERRDAQIVSFVYGIQQPLMVTSQGMIALRQENMRLNDSVGELREQLEEAAITHDAQQTQIRQYESIMGKCGVNHETGQCRAPARGVRPQQTRRQPVPQIELPAEKVEEEKPSWLKRFRGIFSKDKDEETAS